jgi:hypothetical protein
LETHSDINEAIALIVAVAAQFFVSRKMHLSLSQPTIGALFRIASVRATTLVVAFIVALKVLDAVSRLLA